MGGGGGGARRIAVPFRSLGVYVGVMGGLRDKYIRYWLP